LAQLANQAGIRQWDIGVGCSTDSSVQVDRGEAKQLKGAQRSSITVRVWNDANLIGITSSTDLSEAGLARALEGAKAASAFGNPQETPNFSPLATAPLPILELPLCTSLGILNLLRSPTGRAFVAIRDSEISAQSMGIDLAGYKVKSFAISAAAKPGL
jgi:PmbA protein